MNLRDRKTSIFIAAYIGICLAATMVSLLAPWQHTATIYMVGSLGIAALDCLGLALWFYCTHVTEEEEEEEVMSEVEELSIL
jgi:hypothetical protein